jgi:hypothetical protein
MRCRKIFDLDTTEYDVTLSFARFWLRMIASEPVTKNANHAGVICTLTMIARETGLVSFLQSKGKEPMDPVLSSGLRFDCHSEAMRRTERNLSVRNLIGSQPFAYAHGRCFWKQSQRW